MARKPMTKGQIVSHFAKKFDFTRKTATLACPNEEIGIVYDPRNREAGGVQAQGPDGTKSRNG